MDHWKGQQNHYSIINIHNNLRRQLTYPGLDITGEFLPFFRRVGSTAEGADGAAGGSGSVIF